MLMMLWIAKQIYLIDMNYVCVTSMALIYFLMMMTADALRGIFSLTIGGMWYPYEKTWYGI